MRDADARANGDVAAGLARAELEGRTIERFAVVRTRDAERLAETARPGAEQAHVVESAARAHGVDSVRRLERTHEHG